MEDTRKLLWVQSFTLSAGLLTLYYSGEGMMFEAACMVVTAVACIYTWRRIKGRLEANKTEEY
jgi:hypothetical protein